MCSSNNISEILFEKIYFNKDSPENQVIYLPNVKDKRLLIFHDGDWKNYSGEGLRPVINRIDCVVQEIGDKKLNYGGDFYTNDVEFSKLNPGIQNAIKDYFMHSKGRVLPPDSVITIAMEKRGIVKTTLKLTGIKM